MGREIRKVPPGWEHPKKECRHRPTCNDGYCWQPMRDCSFVEAATEWKNGFYAWENGERPSYYDPKDYDKKIEFWEWDGNPPDREFYRPNWSPEEMTWFQCYETVSEGTPVTPPFATQEELIDYLVEHGDFWDQNSGNGGWSREAAAGFVGEGWAPSLIMQRTPNSIEIKAPRDGALSNE